MPINQSALSINVKVNVANNRILATPSATPVPHQEVKTIKSQFATVDSLSDLSDVSGTPQDGYTLVYDSVINKYVSQQLTVQDINLTSLDGGTF